jgi:hypothetical protein
MKLEGWVLMMAAVMPGKEEASVSPAAIYTTQQECEIAGKLLAEAAAKEGIHAEPGCILVYNHSEIKTP